MDIFNKRFYILFVGLIITLIIILSPFQSDVKHESTNFPEVDEDYTFPPLISKDLLLYQERDEYKLILDDTWVKDGKIEKIVSSRQDMPLGQKEYYANMLPLGSEVFKVNDDDNMIYVKINDDKYIKYELLSESE